MGRKGFEYYIQLGAVAAGLIAGLVIFTVGKRHASTIPSAAVQVQGLKDRVLPIEGYDFERQRFWTYGSGSLVRLPSGLTGLLTNHHVCAASSRFSEVLTHYKQRLIGGFFILKSDPKVDLCLLVSFKLIREQNFSVEAINEFRPGEGLLLIGYPLGGPMTPQTGYYITQADMIIAGPMSDATCDGEIFVTPTGLYCGRTERLNAMTTLTYPGNSGSPVFNSDGKMVGVANSGSTQTAQGNFISGSVVDAFLQGF